jgi:hypothetical protein
MEVVNLVGIVRLPIVANALGSEQQREEGRRCLKEKGQVDAPARGSGIPSILRDTMQTSFPETMAFCGDASAKLV